MDKKKKKKEVVEYANLEKKVCAIWTRVSTKDQKDNNSLDIQKKECEAYAEKNNIQIIGYYGDTNESANKEGRLYKAMISEVAKNKEVNIILVYSFDHFSRSGSEGIWTKNYLKSKGIYVISVTQATDPDSAAGDFMENILFLFNQFENNLRKGKCVAGMKECLENGNWFSRPPLGFDKYKKNGEHIIEVNSTGRLLRQAFVWKANENLTDVQIAERLKAFGLNIRKQKLTEIFHNPFYCGQIRHMLLGDKIVQGNQEVLISKEIYDKVNGIESNKGYSHAIETPMYPLKRHIYCAECGCYLTGYEVKAKGLHYYKCNTKGCRSNHNINKLHQLYHSFLSSFSLPIELIPIFQVVLKKVFKERNEGRSKLHKELSKQLTERNNKINKVNIKYGLGDISTEVFAATITTLKDEKAKIEVGLEKAKENLSNLEKYVDKSVSMSCNIGELWQKSNFEIQQKLQNLVFPDGVIYDKEKECYRTTKVNEIFSIFSRISMSYTNQDVKKEPEYSGSYLVVAPTGLEPVFKV